VTDYSVPGLHTNWPLGAVSAPWVYATAAQGQSGTARITQRSSKRVSELSCCNKLSNSRRFVVHPTGDNFTVRQIWHLRMEKVKTRGKLGYPGEILTSKMADFENLDLTRGIPNWEIPPWKNTSDTYETYTMQKAYLAMHGSAWPFRQLRPLPKFLFGYQSTSSLDTWYGLTQRVTRKILGMIPQGNMSY